MRKYFAALLLSQFFITSITAQEQDLNKIADDFQKDKQSSKPVPYGRNKETGKYYNIRGFKMYCEVYGTGQPLLIIHGNGGSIAEFVYQIPYFSKKYKVIIADNRAQGKSYDNGDSLTYEMMADDYSLLLDSMKVDSAYVIGWSDGGINGLLLSIRHPEKVKKLAITGANLTPDTTAVTKGVIDMVAPMLIDLRNNNNKNVFQKNTYKLLRLLLEQPHISLTDLHKIKCPTLVIGGDHDVIKEEHTMLIYKNVPRSYLWILPASGHSTPIVYKDDFNDVVDRFFINAYRTYNAEARFFEKRAMSCEL